MRQFVFLVTFLLLSITLEIQGACQCDDKIAGGFGNCGRSFSKDGRSGPICYVPRVNTCPNSFEGTNGWYSWDPCNGRTIGNGGGGSGFFGCEDDPEWRDNQYGGDGKARCIDLTLDWCNNHGQYSTEARRACPRSCGLCSGNTGIDGRIVDPYPGIDGRPTVIDGRPFTVKGKSRTVTSHNYNDISRMKRSIDIKNHSRSWKMETSPSILANNTLNLKIGRMWLQHAEAEHASVASFARHTLQLMSIGAPADLLVASQQASLDEIKHARICYGISSAFIGTDFWPGALDVEGSLEKMTLKQIIESIIQEGCIEETLSAIEAWRKASITDDKAIKSALSQIASEETNHAQLAWNTIRWIMEKYPEERTFIMDTFQTELENINRPLLNALDASIISPPKAFEESVLRQYGLLSAEDRVEVRQVGLLAVIEPVFHDGLKDVSTISQRIRDLNLSTI